VIQGVIRPTVKNLEPPVQVTRHDWIADENAAQRLPVRPWSVRVKAGAPAVIATVVGASMENVPKVVVVIGDDRVTGENPS
jgi:hypothetical protein